MIDLRLQLFKLFFPTLTWIFWQSLCWVAATYAYSHPQHSVGTLSLTGYARYQATRMVRCCCDARGYVATSRSVELVLEVLPVEAPFVLVRVHACMAALMYRPLKVALWATINGGKKVAMRRQPSSCNLHNHLLINIKKSSQEFFHQNYWISPENPPKPHQKPYLCRPSLSKEMVSFFPPQNGAGYTFLFLFLCNACLPFSAWYQYRISLLFVPLIRK